METEKPQKRIVKVTFVGPEIENVDFLIADQRSKNAQDMIKTLVKQKAEEKRESALRYGTVSREPKETKGEARARMRRELLALDDIALTEALEKMGAFKLHTEDGMVHEITTNDTGRVYRTLYGGAEETVPLESFFRELEREKLL